MALSDLLRGQVEVRVANMVERQMLREEILEVLERDFPTESIPTLGEIIQRGLEAWQASRYVSQPEATGPPTATTGAYNPFIVGDWQTTMLVRFDLPGVSEPIWKTHQVVGAAFPGMEGLQAEVEAWIEEATSSQLDPRGYREELAEVIPTVIPIAIQRRA